MIKELINMRTRWQGMCGVLGVEGYERMECLKLGENEGGEEIAVERELTKKRGGRKRVIGR